jgi:hypothetical protein
MGITTMRDWQKCPILAKASNSIEEVPREPKGSNPIPGMFRKT